MAASSTLPPPLDADEADHGASTSHSIGPLFGGDAAPPASTGTTKAANKSGSARHVFRVVGASARAAVRFHSSLRRGGGAAPHAFRGMDVEADRLCDPAPMLELARQAGSITGALMSALHGNRCLRLTLATIGGIGIVLFGAAVTAWLDREGWDALTAACAVFSCVILSRGWQMVAVFGSSTMPIVFNLSRSVAATTQLAAGQAREAAAARRAAGSGPGKDAAGGDEASPGGARGLGPASARGSPHPAGRRLDALDGDSSVADVPWPDAKGLSDDTLRVVLAKYFAGSILSCVWNSGVMFGLYYILLETASADATDAQKQWLLVGITGGVVSQWCCVWGKTADTLIVRLVTAQVAAADVLLRTNDFGRSAAAAAVLSRSLRALQMSMRVAESAGFGVLVGDALALLLSSGASAIAIVGTLQTASAVEATVSVFLALYLGLWGAVQVTSIALINTVSARLTRTINARVAAARASAGAVGDSFQCFALPVMPPRAPLAATDAVTRILFWIVAQGEQAPEGHVGNPRAHSAAAAYSAVHATTMLMSVSLRAKLHEVGDGGDAALLPAVTARADAVQALAAPEEIQMRMAGIRPALRDAIRIAVTLLSLAGVLQRLSSAIGA